MTHKLTEEQLLNMWIELNKKKPHPIFGRVSYIDSATCEYCEEPIYQQQRYCSTYCAREARRLQRAAERDRVAAETESRKLQALENLKTKAAA